MKLEKEKTDYQDFLSTEDCVLDALQKLTDFAQEHDLYDMSIEDNPLVKEKNKRD
jgi:hypothetical protein